MPFSCFKKTGDLALNEDSISKSGKTVVLPAKKCFFVITAIYNPASYQRRYELYHKFRKHMEKTGAQLVTIECIFPALNQNEFKVTDPNNPLHIQLRSESIYWMKENLINIAVSRLPAHAKWVCWLDADIEFQRSDWINWVDLTIQELEKYSIVQVFKKANFLGPEPRKEVLRVDYSFGYSVVKQKIIDQKRYDEWYPHPGYGWATSITTFNYIKGLPEYDIVGSGDLHFAFSLVNKVSNAIEDDLNLVFKNTILDHSQETYGRLKDISRREGKSLVGFVPVNISHQWHGSRKDRQYVDRWKILIAHNFNFVTDTTRLPNGLLSINPNNPSLQRDILQHFQMRKEDELQSNIKEDRKIKPQKKPKKEKKYFSSPPPPSSSSSSSSNAAVDHHLLHMQLQQQNQCEWEWDQCNPSCPPPPHCGNQADDDDHCRDPGNYSDNYGGNYHCSSQY